MLTKQLRALEEDDLIIRKVYAEVPPRVDYELSETGQRLRPVIDALKVWGDDNRARLDAASQAKAAGAGKARSKTETTRVRRENRNPLEHHSDLPLASGLFFMTLSVRFPRFRFYRSRCARTGAGSCGSRVSDPASDVLCADRSARAARGGERLRSEGGAA
jgi:hypothetical protein